MIRHLVIPDTQCKPGVPLDHLTALGNYILECKPTTIIHLGDHWDFPSLNRYDPATKKAAEGQDFEADLECANQAMDMILEPLRKYNRRHSSRKRLKPDLHYCMGNHDVRPQYAINEQPWMRATYDPKRLNLRSWNVHQFLTPIVIDDISYSHYYIRGANGSITQSKRGMPSAKAQVVREAMSCTAGHKQGLDVHVQPVGNKRVHRGIIAGSFYQHDEHYLTGQQIYWRGVLVKNDVRDGGNYDLMEISLDYLMRKYL